MAKPNILIFMTDHQRYDTVPPYHWCRTPHLDCFSQQAVSFTQAYTTAPHCCPARASFFSGLYPSEHGVWNNVEVGNALSRGLAEGVTLFSEDMRQNGYRMFFSGKWHVSDEEGPSDRGFELLYHNRSYSGITTSREARIPRLQDWDEYRRQEESSVPETGRIVRRGYPDYSLYGSSEHPHDDFRVVDHAEEFLRTVEGPDPWYLYVGVLGPHDPYEVPDEFLNWYPPEESVLPFNHCDSLSDKPALYRKTQAVFNGLSQDQQREALRHYKAFCSYEDMLFGRLLRVLRERNMYEDTLIVYLSDHGDYAGAHGLWTKGLPCFQEAYHIPLLIHMPKQTHGRAEHSFVSITDLAPTLLEAAGICADRSFSGKSLLPLLNGERDETPREYIFTQTNGNELYGIQRSVMNHSWKYVYNGFDTDELYDLHNDPGELKNLFGDPKYNGVVYELSRRLWQFAYQHHDTCVNPYIMVGHAAYGPGIIFERKQSGDQT